MTAAGPSWNAMTAGDPRAAERRPAPLRYRCDEHRIRDLAAPCALPHEGPPPEAPPATEIWASAVTSGPVAAVSGTGGASWALGETIARALSACQAGVWRVTSPGSPAAAYFHAGRRLDPDEVDALAAREARP